MSKTWYQELQEAEEKKVLARESLRLPERRVMVLVEQVDGRTFNTAPPSPKPAQVSSYSTSKMIADAVADNGNDWRKAADGVVAALLHLHRFHEQCSKDRREQVEQVLSILNNALSEMDKLDIQPTSKQQ